MIIELELPLAARRYADLGADYFLHRRDPEHHANKLVRQLRALGYDVKIEPLEAA